MKRALALAALLAACHPSDIDPMKEQPKLKAYRALDIFTDGRAMRAPPEGTVSREEEVDPAIRDGVVKGAYLTKIPIPVDLALVETGRKRFDISCAVCHGRLGDGRSVVADKMSLRLPPSLLTDQIRARSDGQIYQIIQQGYGLMPPYASQIPVRERWAVVAYVRALQRSQWATLDDAPAPERQRLENQP